MNSRAAYLLKYLQPVKSGIAADTEEPRCRKLKRKKVKRKRHDDGRIGGDRAEKSRRGSSRGVRAARVRVIDHDVVVDAPAEDSSDVFTPTAMLSMDARSPLATAGLSSASSRRESDGTVYGVRACIRAYACAGVPWVCVLRGCVVVAKHSSLQTSHVPPFALCDLFPVMVCDCVLPAL
jgi:hypothetical protein